MKIYGAIAPLTDQEAKELAGILGVDPEVLISGETFRWLVDTGIEAFIGRVIQQMRVPPAVSRRMLQQLAVGLDGADKLLKAPQTVDDRIIIGSFLRQIMWPPGSGSVTDEKVREACLAWRREPYDNLSVPQLRAIVEGARALQQSFRRERKSNRSPSSNYPDLIQFLARQTGLAKGVNASDDLPGKAERGDNYETPVLARFLVASVAVAVQKGRAVIVPRSQLPSNHHLHLDADAADRVRRRLGHFAGMDAEKLSRHAKFVRDWQRGQNF